MICINSPNDKAEQTQVVNSRASTREPTVWRRRRGVNSGVTFTTYERPSLADNKLVELPSGSTDTFSLGKLLLSIANAFGHDRHAAEYDSLALAQTVENKLLMSPDSLTPAAIADMTHEALKRFDKLAGMQYAAQHHLIKTVRRGRPAFSDAASN